jgi:FAD:protein FMN transferase
VTPDPVSRRKLLRITAAAGMSLALGGGLAGALVRSAGLERVRSTRVRLGTLVTVTVVHPRGSEARRLVDAAFHEMARLEAILSRHRADTPLARLNREGWLGHPQPELVEVLRRGQEVATISDGAFDLTAAPLVDLYAARFAATGHPPADSEVEATLRRVGFRALDVAEDRITLRRPGMALTLDGIAKGYVVDSTVALLTRSGLDHVLVEAGGDLAATSMAAGAGPWEVAVQDPGNPRRRLAILRPEGRGVATSGDYVQAFTRDRRFHHIVDPRTGRSPEEVGAVTVAAASAMDADALSTAAMVLGRSGGLRLLGQVPGAEGLIVTKGGEQVQTPGFRALMA